MNRLTYAALAIVILSTSMCAAQNSAPGKADPAIYPRMRANALAMHGKTLGSGTVVVVLMDWHVANGTASVLAASDGTASIYLSSGGGFLGGGQRYPQLHDAAQLAVHLADEAISHFQEAPSSDLPPNGEVFFYLTTNNVVRRAVAQESALRNGTDPLLALGNAMQQIVTLYRLTSSSNSSSK
jgi:hypothetical protein